MIYRDYINSQAWLDMRRNRMKLDGFRCVVCGFRHELTVHHKTYDRLGQEKMADLETLCVRCHNNAHLNDKRHQASEAVALRSTPYTEQDYLFYKRGGR